MSTITENEAKTKWCSQAVTYITAQDGVPKTVNRYINGEMMPETRCLGSGCMAWRWHSSTHGYCGLAGRP